MTARLGSRVAGLIATTLEASRDHGALDHGALDGALLRLVDEVSGRGRHRGG